MLQLSKLCWIIHGIKTSCLTQQRRLQLLPTTLRRAQVQQTASRCTPKSMQRTLKCAVTSQIATWQPRRRRRWQTTNASCQLAVGKKHRKKAWNESKKWRLFYSLTEPEKKSSSLWGRSKRLPIEMGSTSTSSEALTNERQGKCLSRCSSNSCLD